MKTVIRILGFLTIASLTVYGQSAILADSTANESGNTQAQNTWAEGQKSMQDSGRTRRLTDLVNEGDPVPSPLTFNTEFKRIVIARMTFGTDLLKGLQDAVKREHIRSAVILTGIGSLTSYHLHSIAKTTLPSENVFYKAEGPYDLLNVSGYVINGRVHAHITVTNEEQAIGGHLEPDTKVYTFGIVSLGVLGDDVDLNRLDDTNWR